MKQYEDKKRSEQVFLVGDMVYLKLRQLQLKTLAPKSVTKLSPKYYGPYEVIAKVGQVTYRLQLPEGSHIHLVFHVSLLKPSLGTSSVSSILPSAIQLAQQETEPIATVDRRILYKHRAPITEVLFCWSNLHPENSTWEYLPDLLNQFSKVAGVL